MELRKRKNIRLKNYDYGQNGAYFITMCVKGRHEMLGRIVGGGFHAAPCEDFPSANIELTDIGCEVEKSIAYINMHNQDVEIVKYVIMPNHVHLIIVLKGGHGNPPLQDIVYQLKSYTTKKWNEFCNTKMQRFWQRSYHDHIIRNEEEYKIIWNYIDTNPQTWEKDCYHTEICNM